MHIIRRVYRKLRHSVDGIKFTFLNEPSFRQWLGLVVSINCFSLLMLDNTMATGGILALSFLLLASELINTSIEVLVDYAHPQQGNAARRAKDCASAMTLLTFLALLSFLTGSICYRFDLL